MACLPQPATGTCFLAAGQASVQLRLADQPFDPVRKLFVLMGLDRGLCVYPKPWPGRASLGGSGSVGIPAQMIY